MSKLLQGRLPFVNGEANVNGVTFNKAVRLLEISLDAFDPDATAQFTENKRDTLKFNAGDLIWNTSINTLQVYDGDNWISLSQQLPYTTDPLEAQGQVGSVQVINAGAIVVSVGS
jgi:hypothetical protein